MKRLAIAFGVLTLAVFTMFIEKDKKKKKSKNSKNEESLLSVEMSGPHGEPVLIGSSGGKYYMKGNRKIYLRYKK